MSNLSDFSSLRRQQLQNTRNRNNNNLSMFGISQNDLIIMGNQIANNRVPFLNIMADDVNPLDESIPYTLKLVWCPAFQLLSFSTFLLISIWTLYIITLTYGINSSYYQILAPEYDTLRTFGAYNYQLLKDGEVWRLIVSAFLHFDLLQIVMSTFYILFVITQLEQCYNFGYILLLSIISAISGNITEAVFASRFNLHVGAGPIVYGALGGFIAYIIINKQALFLIVGQLMCIIGMLFFFAMVMSIGTYGFACFCGAVLGGLGTGLALFPGISGKSMWMSIGGAVGVGLYWLMMFLIFYLAQ